jgi:hypothetical protein
MTTVPFTLRLPEDEYQTLRAAAKRDHRSLRDQIRHALSYYERTRPRSLGPTCPHGLPRGLCSVCISEHKRKWDVIP